MNPADRSADAKTERILPPGGDAGGAVPEQVGPFRILDLVSSSMALVYKAEQDRPRRTVALKIPRGGKLLSRDARERFLREVAAAAAADHAGIVPVLEAGEIDGTPFYTMPFVEGRSLDAFIESERPDLPRRLDVFRRICVVVQTLHERNLVHRDLKPGNLMIDRHGDVRLLDFGLARSCSPDDPAVTGPLCLGTPAFMAPEQTCPGGAPETPAADVYSLGVILYWLLTDTLPYQAGSDPSGIETIRTHRPAPPSHRKPGLTPAYDRLVMSCLDKNPLRRPRSAGDLEARLADTTDRAARGTVTLPGYGLKVAVVLALSCASLGLVLWFFRPPPPKEPGRYLDMNGERVPDHLVPRYLKEKIELQTNVIHKGDGALLLSIPTGSVVGLVAQRRPDGGAWEPIDSPGDKGQVIYIRDGATNHVRLIEGTRTNDGIRMVGRREEVQLVPLAR
jgi:hypothetical protein